VASETAAKATLHQRAMHELREFVILAVYLYITLGAVVLMKTAVLHTEGIEFAFWGIAFVKATMLAKFMLLGKAMKIGERATTSPLIWPTLHKAFAFPASSHDHHRGSRRRHVPPPADRRLAR
jgi:hypothetical protein